MADDTKKVPLAGSKKEKLTQARATGDAHADEFTVTVTVRPKQQIPTPEKQSVEKPRQRKYQSREEHAAEYGADPADIQKVEDFAKSNGLSIVESSSAKRTVILCGTAATFGQAFGVQLKTYTSGGVSYRGREGDIYIPANLQQTITSVTGLDNRPFARPHVRVHRKGLKAAKKRRPSRGHLISQLHAHASIDGSPDPAHVSAGLTPMEVAELYNFPKELDGRGQTIGIIEMGGGFRQSELNTYFQKLGISPPEVLVASYPNGGKNNPGTNALDPSNVDVEVLLDIEVAAGVAPGAKIVVYFAPDGSDQSFLNVMSAAIHDSENNPTILSLSWGGPEETATSQFIQDLNRLLESATQLGITICVAAGDNGSADFPLNDAFRPWDQKAHVDFPASSPYVLACGGTRLNTRAGKVISEVVWHDGANDGTGGGISRIFPIPDYQTKAGIPNAANPTGPAQRGVPDVAGDAAPASGYQILVDDQHFPDPSQDLPPLGGTSAVAPLWAGLIARINQGLGKPAGFVNPLLYALSAQDGAFRDIIDGDNGDYRASKGWDACTGLGTPHGENLLKALS